MTQLAAYIASHGATIEVGNRSFIVLGISGDRDLAVATFGGTRSKARFTAVVSVNRNLVAGKPDAEVWSVVGSARTIARFAVWNDTIIPLR